MKKILVLGGSYLQSSFIENARNDYEIIVLDGNDNAYVKNWHNIKFLNINFAEIEKVRGIVINEKPDLVYAPCNEIGNFVCSKLAQEFGFHYNSLNTVNISLDKNLQREKLGSCKTVFSPQSVIFNNNIYNIENIFGYPFIVKPSRSSGSRGVSLVRNRRAFMSALKEASFYSESNGNILIEQFLLGEQISVETLTFNGKHVIIGITLEMLSGEPYFIERSHLMSPEVFNKYINIIEEPIFELLNTLEVKVGPCHIELLVTDGMVSLIEIATRSGGWRDDLIKYSSDIDYNSLIISSYMNDNYEFENKVMPKRNALLNILLYPEDLQSVVSGSNDQVLKKYFVNQNPPKWQPQNLTDAFGYAYFCNDESLQKYYLK